MEITETTTEVPTLPCAGKLCFATQAEALASAAVLAHRHGEKLKAYKCRYCKWWHLSSR